jgi:hypothetical protein
VDDLKGDMTMPVRTLTQACAAVAVGCQIDDAVDDIVTLLDFSPEEWVGVKHPEMLEEIHWDLTQIKWRLRLAVTGEYDAP